METLNAPGNIGIPGSTGTRNLHDNLSDLRAQVAANKKVFNRVTRTAMKVIVTLIEISQQGIGLVSELIDEYTLPVVQAYMSYVRSNAEFAVRSLLKSVAAKAPGLGSLKVLNAEDVMDDGTCIKLKITIDATVGSAVLDFT